MSALPIIELVIPCADEVQRPAREDEAETVYDYRTNAPADCAPGGRGYRVPRKP